MAARMAPPPSSPPLSTNSHHFHPAQPSPAMSPPAAMQAMTAAVFVPSNLNEISSKSYARSASDESAPFSPPASYAQDSDRALQGSLPGILIRRLPEKMTNRELRGMFIVARDYVDSDFVQSDRAEDKGFATAITRFKSASAAQEVQANLNGKPFSADEADMVVEFLPSTGTGSYLSKNNNSFDASNTQSGSGASSTTSNGPNGQRYNFQPMDNMSPPSQTSGLEYGNSPGSGEFPVPETNSHFQNLFSPQSPIGNQLNDRSRVTGKSVINSDSLNDDETGELLRDPVAYAENGHSTARNNITRRQTGPPVPISRFNNLTLATNGNQANAHSYPSPSRGGPVQTPGSAMSPLHMGPLGPNANYQMSNQFHQRPNYPPVNPADQNPPCNTLYVGNLPIDTSEDELKAMFSKQRGYKRLCFRTKQQGPMCFVEFEDISFATKALNELYGYPLHNSVKGGIRLSFSKNPLGVRSGQQSAAAAGLPTPTIPHGSMTPGASIGSNMSSGSGGGPPFATAAGPPPGLTAPPGLNSTMTMPTVPVPTMMGNVMIPAGYGGGTFAVGGPNPHMGAFRPSLPTAMTAPLLGTSGMSPGLQGNSVNGNYAEYANGR